MAGIHVLCIDDEPSLLELTKIFLERSSDLYVDTLLSAREVLDKLEERNYDVIIADYDMPDIDGIALLKQLREGGYDIPFIIFTGKGREEIVIEAINLGADFYLQKGGDPRSQFAELEHKLRHAVNEYRAKKDVEESEQRYRSIFEHTGSATIIIEDDATIYLANDIFSSLSGYPRSEIEGIKKWTEFVSPDDIEDMYEYHRARRIDPDSVPDKYEFTYITGNGEEKQAYVMVGVIPGTRRSVASVIDMSEKIRYEEELRRTNDEMAAALEEARAAEEALTEYCRDLNEFQQKLVESRNELWEIIDFLPDATFAIDSDGSVIVWNNAIENMTGISREDMIGKNYEAYSTAFYKECRHLLADILLSDASDSFGEYEKSNQNGYSSYKEVYSPYIYGGKGGYLWAKASLLFNSSGAVIGAIETIRDISDKKIVDERLRERERRYRNLMNSIEDFVYTYDTEGRFTEVNQALCRAIHKNPEEIIGKTNYELNFPREMLDRWEDAQALVLSEGKKISAFMNMKLADNRFHYYQAVLNPMRNEDGEIEGIVGISHDITDQKEIHQELESANLKLKILSRLTRHDVANQLTVIEGLIDIIDNDDYATEEVQRHLSEIRRSIDVIKEDIAYTRKFELLGDAPPEWQNIQKIAEKIRDLILPDSIKLDIATGDLEVLADPMFSKTIYNLFENSLRHGGDVTQITISYSSDAESLTLYVKDDGAGVPQDIRETVFEPGVGANTGLGLFFVKEVLAMTCMEIFECGSGEGGACFGIRVPAGHFRFSK